MKASACRALTVASLAAALAIMAVFIVRSSPSTEGEPRMASSAVARASDVMEGPAGSAEDPSALGRAASDPPLMAPAVESARVPAARRRRPPPRPLAASLTWLLAQQRPDGSFGIGDDRVFEVWESLIVLASLERAGRARDAVDHGWAFVRRHIRGDGVVYHHRNTGTALACTETTAQLHATARAEDAIPRDAACTLVTSSTAPGGEVRVNTERSIIPEELQRYPSVTGFALLLAARCPDYRAIYGRALVEHARALLRDPSEITLAWQYFGTDHYALFHLARGLDAVDALDDETAAAYARHLASRQRSDGAIPSPASADTSTSLELHTALAASALAVRSSPPVDWVLARALAWLCTRQRGNGSLDGGIFRGTKREDLYVTALFADLLQGR